ncbi:MAG: glycosyltransferase family 9 protein [Candidatus Binatus sp.]
MWTLGRQISLLIRKADSAKDRRRVLQDFSRWRAQQGGLPRPQPFSKTLVLIRLDDIGDYLLFRNQLETFVSSPRWRSHRITLLGNDSWQSLFMSLDTGSVDEVLWVNKRRYLESSAYRLELWAKLRSRGFETVVAPSRTRPLLLDDLCMLAAAPVHRIGCTNTNVHESWNRLSDELYTSLFTPSRPLMHEFQFNGEFAHWLCGIRYSGNRPRIENKLPPPVAGSYVVCFVGANARSKRWPAKRWIEFTRLHHRYFSSTLFFAGNSKAEIEMVRLIQRRTGAKSIAGTNSLSDLLQWVAGAEALVTNDTMAAHMGASLNTPTVIVASGTNYMRFAEYRRAGIANIATVYPEVFSRRRKRVGDVPIYPHRDTVSADIASIRAETVMNELKNLVQQKETPAFAGEAVEV